MGLRTAIRHHLVFPETIVYPMILPPMILPTVSSIQREKWQNHGGGMKEVTEATESEGIEVGALGAGKSGFPEF